MTNFYDITRKFIVLSYQLRTDVGLGGAGLGRALVQGLEAQAGQHQDRGHTSQGTKGIFKLKQNQNKTG